MVSIVLLSKSPSNMLIKEIEKQTYPDYEIVYARENGIVNAMNEALRRAKGEIFVRIDDDVMLPPDWLKELIEPFSDHSVAGVTGPTYIPKESRDRRDSIRWAENPNWFIRWMFDNDPYARAKIYKCGSVSYGSNFMEHIKQFWMEYPDVDHLEGTNWAMRTNLIRAVGGFDPKFDGVAEWFDTDVEQKIKKLGMGYRLVYNNRAYLYHLVKYGDHFSERIDGFGRMKNWLRFHKRHSKFHPKMIIWFTMMGGYFVWQTLRRLFRRSSVGKNFLET